VLAWYVQKNTTKEKGAMYEGKGATLKDHKV
jgi:hypothetical protein